MGTLPTPAWTVAAVGHPLGHVLGDPPVGVARRRVRHLDQRVVGLAPAQHLADVDLVLAERARHLVVDLHEERDRPDHGGDVLGMAAEREVAVAVRRRHRGKDKRAPGGGPHQPRHVAEVVGDQVAASLVEGVAHHRGQEPRDVAQAGDLAEHVAPLAQGEHLVYADVAQPLVAGLEGVHDGGGLAVAQTHDAYRQRTQLVPQDLGLGPAAVSHAPVSPRAPADQVQDGHDRPVGDGVPVVAGGIGDRDAELRRRAVVDDVVTDRGHLDQQAAAHLLQYLAGHAVLMPLVGDDQLREGALPEHVIGGGRVGHRHHVHRMPAGEQVFDLFF